MSIDSPRFFSSYLNCVSNLLFVKLSTIESMLGSSGAKVLFGILTQPEEGVWFLEDLGSMVELDLSHVTTKPLLYTEGSVVVIQGELHHGGVFKVHVSNNS